MKDPAKSMSDVLRRAGKTAVILQIFSVGLLIVLCLLYLDLSKRYALLQDGVRENAMWSVYQLDREARALDHELDLALATQGGLDAARKNLATRYDILYSRVNLLKDSRFQDFFVGDKTISDSIAEITRIVMAAEPVFNNIKDGSKDNAALLHQASNDIDVLIGTTQTFLTYTNTRISEARSDNRNAATNLERTSAIFLVLLIASVLFLIINLHRQLSNMRDAGVSMENMTRKLSEAYNAADAGNRAKSQFMATIGHEIRTPLNAILGMAELLELSKLQPDVLENVRSIRGSGEALLEILNEILDFSKIEHGKLELESRPVDIRALAESTVNIIRGRAAEHGNSIRLDIPENLEASVVKTDPTRLRQVILNLMSNAVKFTDKGTVTLRVREIRGTAGMRAPESSMSTMILRIEVIDTGIGIDDAGKQKLFKPFSQVDATISRKYGGTGLGLTICKEIVERLGGNMGIESRLGFGSTFWFEIPVFPTDDPVAGSREQNPTSLHMLPEMKILLVEDNRVNQQVATRFLTRLGQKTSIAGNGSIAVSMASEDTYDLILMDMQMPVMDGIEATRSIISGGGLNAKTPIVAMTANASEDDRQACVDAGMQGFELKPITMSRLHTLLASISERNGLVMPDAPAIDLQPNNVVELVHTEPVMTLPDPKTANIDETRKAELIEALGEDDFEELLSSYFDDIDILLADLDQALESNDPTSIDRALHTIKGAAANIGFTSIAGMAEALRHNQQPKSEITKLIALITSQKTNKAA